MAIAIEDIKNKDSLKTWLDAFPGTDQEKRQAAVFIAARAAARVLPTAWDFFEYHTAARKRDLTAIPTVRSVLIPGVASKMPTPEITFAAGPADSGVYTPAAYASDAAASYAAAVAAASAVAAPSAVAYAAAAADFASTSASVLAIAIIWMSIREDCAHIEKHVDYANRFSVFARGLWDGDENPLSQDWEELKSRLGAYADADWSFWINWYDDLLQGREPNWDMLYEVGD